MDFQEAFKRCTMMAQAEVNKNCSPQIDARFYLIVDPDFEEGRIIRDFLLQEDILR